jgi:hypothetical protein
MNKYMAHLMKGMYDELRVISTSLGTMSQGLGAQSSQGTQTLSDTLASIEAVRQGIISNTELQIDEMERTEELHNSIIEAEARRQRELDDQLQSQARRQEIDAQRQREGRVRGFYRWMTRQRLIYNQEDMTDEERMQEEKRKMMKETMMATVAGIGVGAIADSIVPQEEVERARDLRQEYIEMYGSAEQYDQLRTEMFTKTRELNKKYKGMTTPFGAEAINDAMEMMTKAHIPEKIQAELGREVAIIKKVGVDFGEDTAEMMVNAFGQSTTGIVKQAGNVLASQTINKDDKKRILNDLAEFGNDIVRISGGDQKAVQKSTEQYLAMRAAMTDSANGGQIISDDGQKLIQTLMKDLVTNKEGVDATMAQLGLDPRAMKAEIQKGNWGQVSQALMEGMSDNFSKFAGDQTAMDAIFGDAAISSQDMQEMIESIRKHKDEVANFAGKTVQVAEASKQVVDGLTVAEQRAGEVQKGLVLESIKNWVGQNVVFEKTSGWLNELGINYKTLGGVVGGVAGAGKGILDTMLLGKAAGVNYAGFLTRLGTVGTRVGGFFGSIGRYALGCIPAILSFTASAWSMASGVIAATWPVIAIIALLGVTFLAIRSIIKTVKQDWELYVWFFNDIWDSMKQMVTDSVNVFKESIGSVVDWFRNSWESIKNHFFGVLDMMMGTREKIIKWVTGMADTLLSYIQPIISIIEKGIGLVNKVKGAVGLGGNDTQVVNPTTSRSTGGSYVAPLVPTKMNYGGSQFGGPAEVKLDSKGMERGVNDTNKLLLNMNQLMERQEKRSRTDDIRKIPDYKTF